MLGFFLPLKQKITGPYEQGVGPYSKKYRFHVPEKSYRSFLRAGGARWWVGLRGGGVAKGHS